MIDLSDILVATIQQTLLGLVYLLFLWIAVDTIKEFIYPRLLLAKGAEANHFWLGSLLAGRALQLRQIFFVGKVGFWEVALLSLLLVQLQVILFSEWFARSIPYTLLIYIIIHLAVVVYVSLANMYLGRLKGLYGQSVKRVGGALGLVLLSFAIALWAGSSNIHEISERFFPAMRSPSLFVLFINALILTPFFTIRSDTRIANPLEDFVSFISRAVWFTWLAALFIGDLTISGSWNPMVRFFEVCLMLTAYDFVVAYLPKARGDSVINKLLWVNIPLLAIAVVSIFWKA